jgi:HEPN domain-containing protein
VRRKAMQNDHLAADYLRRAGHRIKAVQVLYDLESWADVVRECQEIVEISLKALLRNNRIEVPRIHDVSSILEQNRDRFADDIAGRLDELMEISRALRRDRELAFYGSEDLTPSEFYKMSDAKTALSQATLVLKVVSESNSS